MSSRAIPGRTTPGELQLPAKTLYPTMVVSAFKGGLGKTSIAVALAELLAYQGLRVLLVVTDPQQDARFRLGGKGVVRRGAGSVRVFLREGAQVADLLYRGGVAGAGLERKPDVVVVDTPPDLRPAHLPGVTLVVPVDGSVDTQRNVAAMLPRVQENSYCTLVGISTRSSAAQTISDEDWVGIAEALLADTPLDRFGYCNRVLKFSNEVAEAHAEGRSVWGLPRHHRSDTWTFLRGVGDVACSFFEREVVGRSWGGLPEAPNSSFFIPGYDD